MDQRERVVGTTHRMPNGSGVFEYFVVVAALLRLVAEEMDLLEQVLDIPKAECLVPASWEDIKGDLPAHGKGKVELGKFRPHGIDHALSDAVLLFLINTSITYHTHRARPTARCENRQIGKTHLVVLLECVALFWRAVAADWRDVEHACSELDKGAALDGKLETRNVAERPVQ